MTWMTLRIRPIYNLYAYFHNLGLEVVPYSYENVSECPYIACTCVDELSTGVVVNFFFFTMLPPDMARIAIRVLGQCQKHGASLADDIAKWCFARFFLRPFFGSRSAHLAAPSDHHYEHTLFHTCQMKNRHADVSIYRFSCR